MSTAYKGETNARGKLGSMMVLLLKNLIFTLLVPGTVAVLGPILISENSMVAESWFVVPGLLLLSIGIAIYCWCLWDFAVYGQATPAPIDAPKCLIIRGLYRYVRNPMYVGVLSVILAWFFLFIEINILVYCLVIATCFQFFVVFYEEPLLQKMFGVEYAEYQASVNRWLPINLTGKFK